MIDPVTTAFYSAHLASCEVWLEKGDYLVYVCHLLVYYIVNEHISLFDELVVYFESGMVQVFAAHRSKLLPWYHGISCEE